MIIIIIIIEIDINYCLIINVIIQNNEMEVNMEFNLWEFIVGNLEAAGVIGGYVSISIIGVALITFATRKKLKGEGQIGPKWAQPIIGALLGVIPGCGGTIVASSMYKNKRLSFGGLFAAFITTLGEGSFVLLGASDEADVAANLAAFAVVNLVGFIVGAILGYVADATGFNIKTNETPEVAATLDSQGEHRNQSGKDNSLAHNFIEKFGFYIILAMSAFLLPGSIMALWGGGIEALEGVTVWVAIALTVISIIYYLVYRYSYKGHCFIDNKDIKSSLLHSVSDIAMVVMYVFIGLFVANFIIDVLVGAEAFDLWMTSSAFVVVLIAALIGATPGCGGMIAVAAAFTTVNNFPIAALIAAAIATSGDGIFPLIAENKKDAIVITVSGLAVALVVGYAVLASGFSI